MPSGPKSVSVDASVLIAAASPREAGHLDAKTFLTEAHSKRAVLDVPIQFLFEVFAAFRRSPRDVAQLSFMADPMNMNLRTMTVDDSQEFVAWLAAAFPGQVPTRGGDLMYVWVAWKFKVPLVSLDVGMQQYSAAGLTVLGPKGALSLLQ